MHLYRIMVDVRAGAAQQPQCTLHQRGLVTVWVKADSEEKAIERARHVIDSRQYEETGELAVYLEETTHVESYEPRTEREGLGAGYSAMKAEALRQGDGLFELWFPE